MRWLTMAALAVACALLAGETPAREEKQSINGTWKWSVSLDGRKREMTVKLRLQGDRLTGTAVGPDGEERPIEGATYTGGAFSFTVAGERGGRKFTTRFTGKLSGDVIRGKAEFDSGGETRTREWEAKRSRG